ncbi:BMC domain-containing protein [Clostridium sp. FS41]|uniref:BMC domain-containing protein n=1 Tax=Clostridia TaxID=186801 RepID=UPI0005D32969|nr:BMC domain-containing protein [Clostridium sp. FS41]KJJ73212.1 hypothetical protein CLFS41_18560 [Clostridium sp. FS41]
MQALGLIETKGLLAAIEAADAMLKAADVSILETIKVGGGRMNVSVTGDVAAVKAAVDAAGAAVERLGAGLLLSSHVIPWPHEELETVIGGPPPGKPPTGGIGAEGDAESTEDAAGAEGAAGAEDAAGVEDAGCINAAKDREYADNVQDWEEPTPPIIFTTAPDRHALDCLAAESGAETAVRALVSLKVTELRALAREYPELGIGGREISKANKTLLLTEFKAFYDRTEQ